MTLHTISLRKGLIVTAAALGLAASPVLGIASASAQCMPGDHVDNSTAAQATQKFQHAGYNDVRDLKKGCDSFWHARAMQNGKQVMVVLSPQGKVMLEGRSLAQEMKTNIKS